MKRTEYIVDKFVDYTGKERQFVMAAVSLHGEAFIDIQEDWDAIESDGKVLSIGVSVCRPNDEFDESIGKSIAEGKAIKKRDHALYATDAGLINDIVVKALLKQEAEYFKNNPGRYLAGYDSDKAKFEESERIEGIIENLSEEGKAALNYINNLSDEDIENFVDAVNYISQ